MLHIKDSIRPDCRYFNGYKPCQYKRSCLDCPHHTPVDKRILLINLGAMGDVVRTTALLPCIRRVYPNAHITWLTERRAAPLLDANELVDRVMVLGTEAIAELQMRTFQLVLNVDKHPAAASIAMQVAADERRGFGLSPEGAIVPFNPSAWPLYALGLDDEAKFRTNQRNEQDLLAEAMGFPYRRDAYVLSLEPSEKLESPRRKVGFNTGCSPLYPYKKLPLAVLADAIRKVSSDLDEPVLLLGGPEDTDRNDTLAQALGPLVETTPTTAGLRRGLAEIDRCDVVVTGDSLGMHMAIGLGKYVVAWFGPTCPQEIDLYDRGIKLLAQVGCAPCWKQRCDNDPMCHDQVPIGLIRDAVFDCLDARSTAKPVSQVRGGDWWRPDAKS